MAKYVNTANAFIPTGTRESCPPYGVTRDYSEEEIQKLPDLREAILKGYFVPYDPAKHTAPASPQARKTPWVTAPDNQGGTPVVKKTSSGRNVEYVVADAEGVDGVSIPDTEMIASIPGEKPVDYIEKGVSAREADGKTMKTKWTNASDAFEETLKQENEAEIDVDDEDILAEGDAKRESIPDADAEIAKDYATIIKPQGNQGAVETTVEAEVKQATAEASRVITEAVKDTFDDNEVVEGASEEVTKFLVQSYAAKKWFINKESRVDFLKEVTSITKSDNLKKICDQRLSELEALRKSEAAQAATKSEPEVKEV